GECLKTECQVVFILFGNVCNIGDIVKRVKDGGKRAIVHMDLVNGLSSTEISVDFIKNTTQADGIISTKPMIVKRAKELGLLTIQRFFIIDSIALENSKRQIEIYHPDCVEIMPGIMPKILKDIRAFVNVPVIAGGLLTDKKDVMGALSAGADAISTTNENLWKLQ
ncbi:MAG: glycerol-3-phosphate responsive antiterminator, partial [Frisingicoccus sp.]|nr:glycerol-3-phosphate responsive antiterminator [Frisingicoccus sp.]